MKKYFVLVCAAMLATVASAQITWNAKLGGGFSSCTTDGSADLKSHFVGKVGVGIEYPVTPNLSLMPSLEVAMKGAKSTITEFGSTYSWKSEEELNLFYLQIPVLVAYRINLNDDWNLTVKAGPYFGYAVSGELEEDYSSSGMGSANGKHTYDIFSSSDMDGDEAQRFDAGVDVGVDLEYHRFVVGLEYERGFLNFSPGSSDKIYNQAFYLTVGYKF